MPMKYMISWFERPLIAYHPPAILRFYSGQGMAGYPVLFVFPQLGGAQSLFVVYLSHIYMRSFVFTP
jgi:hypothetical protein